MSKQNKYRDLYGALYGFCGFRLPQHFLWYEWDFDERGGFLLLQNISHVLINQRRITFPVDDTPLLVVTTSTQ